MEPLKHECGIAMIRLRKPLDHYRRKYDTSLYGLGKLCLLMEKQHNRGQEGAGMACVKLSPQPGEEYIFRDRKEGSTAISQLFASIHQKAGTEKNTAAMYDGECYMGHLRYSTTGRSGISYVHPFLRRSNYRANTLALCGNFNLTNVEEVFSELTRQGQHPRHTSDTALLLEQIGHQLDRETERIYRQAASGSLTDTEIKQAIERDIKIEHVLSGPVRMWDGGYVICGTTGSGEMFAVRDPWGIRTAFYYADSEIVVVASERPVVQTVMNVAMDRIHEIRPGQALIIGSDGEFRLSQIVPQRAETACSFERIYFSRGNDKDIYTERKALGRHIVPQVLKAVDGDLQRSVFSFIPNTAEVAFFGMYEGLNDCLDRAKTEQIAALDNKADREKLASIIEQRVRVEKVAIKDIKLRTFISEMTERNDLANHVYDITYGSLQGGVDNLVVIDDSIVRGTTLRQSIITILSRLNPRKLVVVSSAPQIRYPDFYGIDMSNIGDLIAFRAAVELSDAELLHKTYTQCKEQENASGLPIENYVRQIYASVTEEQISAKIAQLVTPAGLEIPFEIVFQQAGSLRKCCPHHTGDWYFTGDYPTAGGLRLLNQAYIQFYENDRKKV